MNILILHAHPRSSASVVQRAMLRAVAGLETVTLVDLYAEYPVLRHRRRTRAAAPARPMI